MLSHAQSLSSEAFETLFPLPRTSFPFFLFLIPQASAWLCPFRVLLHTSGSCCCLGFCPLQPHPRVLNVSMSAWPLGQTASAGLLLLICFQALALGLGTTQKTISTDSINHSDPDLTLLADEVFSGTRSLGFQCAQLPRVTPNLLGAKVCTCVCTHRDTPPVEAWDTVPPHTCISSLP